MTTSEELLWQAWKADGGELNRRNYEKMTGKVRSWQDQVFVIDTWFAYVIAEHVTQPADKAKALDYWRNRMVAVLDEEVQHLKAEASPLPQ